MSKNHILDKSKTKNELVKELNNLRSKVKKLEKQTNTSNVNPNQKFYTNLYEFNPLMYFAVDTKGIVLYVNQKGSNKLGYEIGKITSLELLNILKTYPKVIENDYVFNSPFCIEPSEIISETLSDREKIKSLTAEEIKILKSIVNGLSNRKISDEQKISIRTVEAHRSCIMTKLEIDKLVDLFKFAIKHGIV